MGPTLGLTMLKYRDDCAAWLAFLNDRLVRVVPAKAKSCATRRRRGLELEAVRSTTPLRNAYHRSLLLELVVLVKQRPPRRFAIDR